MASTPDTKSVLCALPGLASTAHTSLMAESSASITVAGLYCDHAVNPPAVDHLKPTLSWILSSARRGSRGGNGNPDWDGDQVPLPW